MYYPAMRQTISLLGAFLVLIPFALSQLGRLTTDSRVYHALNLSGATILMVIAILERQYGFILLEGVWMIMSMVGLRRVMSAAQGR